MEFIVHCRCSHHVFSARDTLAVWFKNYVRKVISKIANFISTGCCKAIFMLLFRHTSECYKILLAFSKKLYKYSTQVLFYYLLKLSTYFQFKERHTRDSCSDVMLGRDFSNKNSQSIDI